MILFALEDFDKLFEKSGFQDIRKYRYWDVKNKCFDFDGMCEDLRMAPVNAVIVLQGCAHNPTGCDPTREQWMEISNIIKVTYKRYSIRYQMNVQNLNRCHGYGTYRYLEHLNDEKG